MLFFRHVAIFLSNRVTTFFLSKADVFFCIHYNSQKQLAIAKNISQSVTGTSTVYLPITILSYCVCVKRRTLCSFLCSSSPSSSRNFASVNRNIGKFGAKNYFTDHRTANTEISF